jgi:hypothetical protein
MDRNHRQFADGYRRSIDLHYDDLEVDKGAEVPAGTYFKV